MNRHNDNGQTTGYGNTHHDLSRVGAEIEAKQAERDRADRARMAEAAAQLRADREDREGAEKAQRAAQRAAQKERRATGQAQAEARLRAEARSLYVGTDASFEADWPTIRANMAAARVAWQTARDAADLRERTRDNF